jgi:Raf kinase inhibitor-like YbhB/YbcL family protein
MQLKSSQFSNQQMMPINYSCKGNNISPPLQIIDVPGDALSLALILHDPDSPNGNFVHWLMWNIPPNVTEIKENSVPTNAVQGVNDFGNSSYGGACPHTGTHRYIFSLYALDFTPNWLQNTSKEEILSKIQGHTLAQTTLTGLFGAG